MAATPSREQDYYDEVRAANRDIWNGVLKLKSLQPEWNANDYGNTLADGEGGNDGLTQAQIGAVVFAAADALEDVLQTGIGGNMAAIL